jgi:hypothetical protein
MCVVFGGANGVDVVNAAVVNGVAIGVTIKIGVRKGVIGVIGVIGAVKVVNNVSAVNVVNAAN